LLAASLHRALIGAGVIVLIFAVFAVLLFRARRTHTRRIGGISYWELIGGRFPRLRRRKR
jgi:hypothetical protein